MWTFASVVVICATIGLVVYYIAESLSRSSLLAELRLLVQRTAAEGQPASAGPPLPDRLMEWVAAESEVWAAEDLASRARELFEELDDGNADSTWARVMQRLEQEEGVSG